MTCHAALTLQHSGHKLLLHDCKSDGLELQEHEPA